MKIHFFGDISLDGVYCDPLHHEEVIKNISWLDADLGKSDLRVANWESPIWVNGYVNNIKKQHGYPILCTTSLASETVLPLNLNLALLGNNHLYDYSDKGFYKTIDFLSKNKISYIGAGVEEEKSKPFLFVKDNISICILNYVGTETHPCIPNDSLININEINQKKIISDILKYAGEVDHVLVTLHWGADELVRIPSPSQRKLARKLIDKGASAVIGSHVHCLQGWEKYNNGIIIYSLGNFLFGPSLVVPGKVHSLRTGDNNKIGVVKMSLTKTELNISWDYYHKKTNSLILRPDTGEIRKLHEKLCTALDFSDKTLKRKYKIEVLVSVARNYIVKNDGILKSLLSFKMKHLKLLKRVFSLS